MSEPTNLADFAKALRTPEWWAQDRAIFQAQLSEFDGIPLANMPPATAAQIGALALAKTVHVYEILEALALERRPGRPRNISHEPMPERPIAVTPLPELNAVELMGKRISMEQARTIYTELGNLPLNATDAADGTE